MLKSWYNPDQDLKPLPGWGRSQEDIQSAEHQIRLAMEKEKENPIRRIRVLAQCKAEMKALSSRPVREMEGVMAHFHGK